LQEHGYELNPYEVIPSIWINGWRMISSATREEKNGDRPTGIPLEKYYRVHLKGYR
jgi:hypothetical protein